eukprot:827162-Pleurochrysis_carterae.AAC.1
MKRSKHLITAEMSRHYFTLLDFQTVVYDTRLHSASKGRRPRVLRLVHPGHIVVHVARLLQLVAE